MQNLLISGTESAWKGVWKWVSQGSILGLELLTFFPVLQMAIQEGAFVNFVDGAEVGQIAYLVDESRFTIIQNEGPN